MKNNKLIASLIAMSLVATSLIACGGGSASKATSDNANNSNQAIVSANNAGTIKFGVFEPQTGENGGGGLQEVFGIRFANQLYKTITVGGKEYTIELDEVDNKSDKTEAVNAANKLVRDKVVGVLGSYGSGVSIAAGEFFRDAKIPAIGCSCTNPQVTNGNDFYFRTCFLDPFQGTVMANYAKKNGYTKVAVITQLGDDYSEGLGNFFIKACDELKIEVVGTEKFQTNEQDFRSILTNIKAKDPQFIFAPSSIASAPLILEQAKELGITCQIGGGDTWENGTIIENAHGAAEGMVLTTFYDEKSQPTEEGTKFVNGFKEYLTSIKQPDIIPAVSALGYDAYLALYKAIELADSLDGEAIRDALTKLSYVGVTGDISFDSNGDAKKNAAYIKEVKDGEFVFKEITKLD